MLKSRISVFMAAAALAIATVTPAAAYQAQSQSQANNPSTSQRPETADSNERAPAENVSGGRTRQTQSRRQRGPAAVNPEEARAAAQAMATAAGLSCQVTEATLRGENAEKQKVYEAVCASGPGYVLMGSTPPAGYDCISLASVADRARAADPAADVGMQCDIAANKDVMRVMAAFAAEAGFSCRRLDQGAAIGKASNGNLIYEVGCANEDGAWLEKTPTGWTVSPCFQIALQNATCRFTTKDEQAASLKAWLVGSDAAACDVTEARFMGANANGKFYEAKCAAGDGYIARFSTDMLVQQIYPCATAQRIGGGCKLTVVEAAPATETPAPAPAQ